MFNARLCTKTFWSPEFFPLGEYIVFLPTGNPKNKYLKIQTKQYQEEKVMLGFRNWKGIG